MRPLRYLVAAEGGERVLKSLALYKQTLMTYILYYYIECVCGLTIWDVNV